MTKAKLCRRNTSTHRSSDSERKLGEILSWFNSSESDVPSLAMRKECPRAQTMRVARTKKSSVSVMKLRLVETVSNCLEMLQAIFTEACVCKFCCTGQLFINESRRASLASSLQVTCSNPECQHQSAHVFGVFVCIS